MVLPSKFGSLRGESWPALTEWSELNYWWGREYEIYRIKKEKKKEYNSCTPTLTFLMPSDRDIWSYMYIYILDKYLSGCIFPDIYFTAWKEAQLLPGLWLLKVKLPLNLGSPVDFSSGEAQCPRTHMGVIWLSFLCLSFADRRRFHQKGKGRHYLPALRGCCSVGNSLLFCFVSLPYTGA